MSSEGDENDTLTKSNIVDAVYDRVDATKRETADYVDAVIETIKETAEGGDDVKISTFGKFVVRHKDERIGRNPKTGVEITIPERKVVRFKVSEVFKDELNGEREFDGF
ncbi:MAG: integration host factor subunit alpha [Bradymonadaceae bacterium]